MPQISTMTPTSATRKHLSINQIMERIQKLSLNTSVRMREKHSTGPTKWYVSLSSVVMGSLHCGGWYSCVHSFGGATPEIAIRNTWRQILKESQRPGRFFLFQNCGPKEYFPGNAPQVWVRWNEDKDCWEDVVPTEEALRIHNIPADRIRLFADHGWRQRI